MDSVEKEYMCKVRARARKVNYRGQEIVFKRDRGQ